jgi:hypothetical protein
MKEVILTKIRLGVLGRANIAVRSIIPAVQELKEYFDLVGVATRNIESDSAAAFKIIDGYETMLDKRFIDAIYIPLPNSLHYKWVKKSLEKGIHVLVEKSLSCTYEEVIELNSIAKEKDLALLENFQFRFHSQLQYILNLLKEETLGDLRIIRSSFCFPPFKDVNNIRYKKELGGGALLDAGAYPVKLSQILLGNNVHATAAKLNGDKEFDVDIWGSASIEQNSGELSSQIAFGFDNYYQCNLEIVGSKGRLYTNRIYTAGDTVKPSISIEVSGQGIKEVELESDNHFKNMLLCFYELVTGIKDKNQEYADNINQSRLLQEIKKISNGK